ncbi:MAG: beta-aspartyl-peptidase [Flavobacterium sp. BFFFF2]|nr:MAG: beta-aspartyl-peptidase [Flavobacterium sp. BFFFF2]
MKNWTVLLLLVTYFTSCQLFSQSTDTENNTMMNDHFGLVLHGGAGNMAKKNLSPELEQQYKETMKQALLVGHKMLQDGKSAVDVVEAVIQVLEDAPIFNAGKGAVFTHDGHNEMDAAIMDGKTRDAGAVANVQHIRNPISAAKAILQKSKFVLLSGKGAEKFAQENGVTLVDSSYFFYQPRWDDYLKIKNSKNTKLDHDTPEGGAELNNKINKFGTVGCVVLDRFGHLAAGTSTGGIANKDYNRIGDSPLIGAGTYANDETCAISCTGHGEDFIRGVVAYDIAAQMEYKHRSLKRAVKHTLEKLTAHKGRGGLIAIDQKGNMIMEFNTNGMFRGNIDQNGLPFVAIY